MVWTSPPILKLQLTILQLVEDPVPQPFRFLKLTPSFRIMNHLHCPYPTYDEKVDLMRRTGIQLYQLHNWFINARRREFKDLIKKAKSEALARSAWTDILPGESTSDFGDMTGSSSPLRDSRGQASYDSDASSPPFCSPPPKANSAASVSRYNEPRKRGEINPGRARRYVPLYPM